MLEFQNVHTAVKESPLPPFCNLLTDIFKMSSANMRAQELDACGCGKDECSI